MSKSSKFHINQRGIKGQPGVAQLFMNSTKRKRKHSTSEEDDLLLPDI
jgi:hypothetical protein